MKLDWTLNAPTIIALLAMIIPLIFRAGLLIAESRANAKRQDEKWDEEHEWRLRHEADDAKHFDRLYELLRQAEKPR